MTPTPRPPAIVPGSELPGLEDLCRALGLGPQWVGERIAAGLLEVHGQGPADWRFDTVAVWRMRCMAHIERDFGAAPELAALVADLQAEIGRLRARLARHGVEPIDPPGAPPWP